MSDEKKWYLEYSPYQKCYHVDTIDKIIEQNRFSIRMNRNHGFVIIDGPLTLQEVMNKDREVF